MTDQPSPIRPLPTAHQAADSHVVRFRGTDEVDILQGMAQWCSQNRGITILAINWSYSPPETGPRTGYNDEICVDLAYEGTDD